MVHKVSEVEVGSLIEVELIEVVEVPGRGSYDANRGQSDRDQGSKE